MSTYPVYRADCLMCALQHLAAGTPRVVVRDQTHVSVLSSIRIVPDSETSSTASTPMAQAIPIANGQPDITPPEAVIEASTTAAYVSLFDAESVQDGHHKTPPGCVHATEGAPTESIETSDERIEVFSTPSASPYTSSVQPQASSTSDDSSPMQHQEEKSTEGSFAHIVCPYEGCIESFGIPRDLASVRALLPRA